MKILVPVDGSKQSEKALDYIINLAKQFHFDKSDNEELSTNINQKELEIIILHILPAFQVPLGFERPMRSSKTGEVISFSDYINELNETFINQWENKLSDYRKKYESKCILIDTTLRKQGESIADTIIDVANKEQMDLIVVGNVGLGGISKIKSLGSVSRSVSEMAKCPVLIVH